MRQCRPAVPAADLRRRRGLGQGLDLAIGRQYLLAEGRQQASAAARSALRRRNDGFGELCIHRRHKVMRALIGHAEPPARRRHRAAVADRLQHIGLAGAEQDIPVPHHADPEAQRGPRRIGVGGHARREPWKQGAANGGL
jgi:hypothetical protein